MVTQEKLKAAVLAKLTNEGLSLAASEAEIRKAFATVVMPSKCIQVALKLKEEFDNANRV